MRRLFFQTWSIIKEAVRRSYQHSTDGEKPHESSVPHFTPFSRYVTVHFARYSSGNILTDRYVDYFNHFLIISNHSRTRCLRAHAAAITYTRSLPGNNRIRIVRPWATAMRPPTFIRRQVPSFIPPISN